MSDKQNQQSTTLNKERKDIFNGAFLTLKANNMIDPLDGERYSTIQNNMMKAQGLLMLFSVYWARLLEVGNFPLPTKNRWVYYGGCVFIPSIFHAVYIGTENNKFTISMDKKYTPDYYNKYLNKMMLKKA